MLNWENGEDLHVIVLQQGKAVITEKKQGTEIVYLPHIEDKQGIIIASFEHGFEDFETADAFVDANLIELDRIGVDKAEFQRKLTSVLDYCVTLLSEPDRIFHRKRLESIKGWLNNEPATYDTSDLPQNDWKNYVFDWHMENNQYQVEVAPHGVASIEEFTTKASAFQFGVASLYKIQIKDSTGTQLKDYYPMETDFIAAETRLRDILHELELPFIDESYLDYLSFTLQICQRLLPPDTDLMQYVRLGYIENYLGEVLP